MERYPKQGISKVSYPRGAPLAPRWFPQSLPLVAASSLRRRGLILKANGPWALLPHSAGASPQGPNLGSLGPTCLNRRGPLTQDLNRRGLYYPQSAGPMTHHLNRRGLICLNRRGASLGPQSAGPIIPHTAGPLPSYLLRVKYRAIMPSQQVGLPLLPATSRVAV